MGPDELRMLPDEIRDEIERLRFLHSVNELALNLSCEKLAAERKAAGKRGQPSASTLVEAMIMRATVELT